MEERTPQQLYDELYTDRELALQDRLQKVFLGAIPNSRLLGNHGVTKAQRLLQGLLRGLNPMRSSSRVTFRVNDMWQTLSVTDFADAITKDTLDGHMSSMRVQMSHYERNEYKKAIEASLHETALGRLSPSSMPTHASRGVAIGIVVADVKFIVDCNGDSLVWDGIAPLSDDAMALIDRTAFISIIETICKYKADAFQFLMGWLVDFLVLPSQRKAVLTTLASHPTQFNSHVEFRSIYFEHLALKKQCVAQNNDISRF